MRVLVIADAKVPVPPERYGGTERIVALLCEGMAARGHQVTLLAAAGSRSYGRLVTHPWAGHKRYSYRAWCKIRFHALSLWAARDVDVVINFGRVDYLASLLIANAIALAYLLAFLQRRLALPPPECWGLRLTTARQIWWHGRALVKGA